jgi:hypothetical protein
LLEGLVIAFDAFNLHTHTLRIANLVGIENIFAVVEEEIVEGVTFNRPLISRLPRSTEKVQAAQVS